MTLEEIKNCLCVGTFSNLKISWNEEASNYLNAEQTLNYDAKKKKKKLTVTTAKNFLFHLKNTRNV